jgi:hypothetical protein
MARSFSHKAHKGRRIWSAYIGEVVLFVVTVVVVVVVVLVGAA